MKRLWPNYIINSADKTLLSCYTTPPTRHYRFVGNYLPFLLLGWRSRIWKQVIDWRAPQNSEHAQNYQFLLRLELTTFERYILLFGGWCGRTCNFSLSLYFRNVGRTGNLFISDIVFNYLRKLSFGWNRLHGGD